MRIIGAPERTETLFERRAFTESARGVFRQLQSAGPATRPQLCDVLHVSRPTMSAAISELEQWSYIEKFGEVQGALGRAAGMYRLSAGAGHILAIDAGSTHVRVRASLLDGRALFNHLHPLPAHQRHMSAEISLAVAEVVAHAQSVTLNSWGPLRAIGIALPSRVPPASSVSNGADSLFAHFEPPAGVPLLLENNVNSAAIAEKDYGAAQDCSNFIYLQIGVKIGMGVILRNELVRGHNGATGEISYLPFPWLPGTDTQPEALENYLGAEALLRRVQAEWTDHLQAPQDPAALFALAAAGHPVANRYLQRHAEDIGRVAAACISVLDPGLVVLGGGVGNSPLILPHVRATVSRIAQETKIVSSTLGPDGTLLGVAKLAAAYAQEQLLGEAV